MHGLYTNAQPNYCPTFLTLETCRPVVISFIEVRSLDSLCEWYSMVYGFRLLEKITIYISFIYVLYDFGVFKF